MCAVSLLQSGKWSWEPETGWAALLPAPDSLASQEPFSPLQPLDPCTHRVFTALWWDSQLYCSAQIFNPWIVWSRTFQRVLVAWAAPQNPRQQNAAHFGHRDLSFAFHCKQMRAEQLKSKPRQTNSSWISYSTDQSWYLKDLTNFFTSHVSAFPSSWILDVGLPR